MSTPQNLVESNLRRAAARWKWLRILQHAATIGGIFCLLFGLLGIAMIRGWLVYTNEAVTLTVLLSAGAFVALLLVAVLIANRRLERKTLAGSLENADPRLQDRLNTLVHLQKNVRADQARWFLPRIFRQSQKVLQEQKPLLPFSAARPLIHLGIFVFLLAGTIFLYHKYSPWQRLADAESERLAKAASVQKPLELALPTNNVAEEKKPWGEVRITDPARDMKVTKVDVVPMQIEAAANESLKKVGWFSTVNGTDEKPHELPPPGEPRYAVYQPVLYLDELRLEDWDVLTYYASAHTDKGDGYASEVYFLEVRPFREDILKMPGGEDGEAYQFLSEMTAFIERQQHIIRQTHQYQQQPETEIALRKQDRGKLSGAEDDLSDSVRHLYAKMSSEMENKPIGEALDNLAKAERHLDAASNALQDDVMKDAQNGERSALTDLIAARKMFQKAISDHPDQFGKKKKDGEDEPLPESMKKLGDIAEFRNEAKVAQDFVQKTIEQQRKLAEQAANATRSEQNRLAGEESKLSKSLQDFSQQHPQVFKAVTNESVAATNALGHAADLLQKKSREAGAATETGVEKLEALQSAMNNRAAGHELGDAYKLKDLLDEQIKTLQKFQQASNDTPRTNLQQTAAESRETLDQLKQIAEGKQTGKAFGPSLRDSLSGTNKSGLDSKLDQLGQTQGKDGQQQAAGAAAKALESVSQAFSASEPSAMQSAQKHDALKPGQEESFERGMQQLESLKQDLENGHPLPAGEEARQRREALMNLKEGLFDVQGQNEHAKQLMVQLETDLKERGSPLDLAALKKLMDELRNFSVEVADKREKSDNPEITSIDPSRLTPAYRGRIQKYYQKLSDQKP